jgi:hypothetical protein
MGVVGDDEEEDVVEARHRSLGQSPPDRLRLRCILKLLELDVADGYVGAEEGVGEGGGGVEEGDGAHDGGEEVEKDDAEGGGPRGPEDPVLAGRHTVEAPVDTRAKAEGGVTC